jgi:glycosyltransferase involved in cell wall biosynthesis
MTLLLVNKYHFIKGGAERYYLDLGKRLSARGDRVVYLSMQHPENVPAGEGDAFVEGVDYRARMGVFSRLRHALRSIYNGEAARAAHGIVRRSRPRIAHLHNVYHQLSPSVIRALDADGIPVVQTLHDYKLICPAYLLMTQGEVCERCRGGRYFETYRHRCLLDSKGASFVAMAEAYLHRWLRTYEKVRTFICPSRFMMEKVASFGIDPKRLVHLPYFLPIDRYQPGQRGAPYYVYAGRLSREKGMATLLEAHARLPRSRIPLRVLGDGPMRGVLETRKEELGLDDVTFEGYQKAEDLNAIIGGALFAAVPSEWYENYPFAILEAFALGRPVLGTRIGGIPELVRDGETGLTASPGDPNDLAEGIAKLMRDPAKADSMGRAARSWVAAELAPGPHIERLDAIYREVAA